MKSKLIAAVVVSIAIMAGCERNIDIDLQTGEQKLIVEAYVSNLGSLYNYVVISNSLDYYNPNFQSLPAKNAIVSITEGTKQTNGSILWDAASTVQLQELNSPLVPLNFRSGFYIDPRIVFDSANALKGRVGKHYRLNIKYENQDYTGYTELLQPVPLDSVNYGYPFVDEDSIEKVRITNNYRDPDTIGNAYFYYWRFKENRRNFGWAGLRKSGAPGRDDQTNGEYIRITHPQPFDYNDTIDYMLTHVTRQTHTFWDSYLDARNNGGPFATPVTIKNYIEGKNVLGCLMGLSVSQKTIITRR
jgi:hypothetical protein